MALGRQREERQRMAVKEGSSSGLERGKEKDERERISEEKMRHMQSDVGTKCEGKGRERGEAERGRQRR